MVEIQVANVVGLITYQQELDLSALEETFKTRDEVSDVVYDPADNHWLQVWLEPDDTYVAFYRSGKCSVVGADSVQSLDDIVDKVNTLMYDLLEFEYDPEADVKNIVATSQIDSIPSLETLAIGLGLESVEYEPEQFPALIYRDSDYVALIFSSGRIVCTGLSDINAIESALAEVFEKIQSLNQE